MQRLEVLVAGMLARERRVLADAEAGGCTALAAAVAALPSGVLQMVADAVAALGRRTPFSAGLPERRPQANLQQALAASVHC